MFQKIAQKKVYLEILEQIKALVATGVLRPGSRLLSERQMAEEMGVSRAAIREAVRSLELVGLVRCVQGEGNFLADSFDNCLVEPLSLMFMLDGGDIRQVQQLRHALEIKNAELAAAAATPAQVDALQELCSAIQNEQDERVRAELDRSLHYRIATIAGNSLINSVLNASSSLIEKLIIDIRVRIISGEKNAQLIDQQHFAIVDGIRRHDASAAVAVMGEHMCLIDKYLDEYL